MSGPAGADSFGTLSVVGYTLLPNRVFGGDTYNPFTNSLYLDSDVPAIAMMEAAYAKRIHAQKLPGTYVAAAIIPGVGLARQCRAVGDVLGYARAEHDWEIERQGYQVLYAQVGAEAGTYAVLVTPVWWAAPVMGAGGAAAGHAAGRMIAARRMKEVEPPGSQQLARGGDATTEAARRTMRIIWPARTAWRRCWPIRQPTRPGCRSRRARP